MKQDNFIFVLTPLKVLCSLPKEIIPGYVFQKATETQVVQIKNYFNQLQFDVRLFIPNIYEAFPKLDKESNHQQYFPIQLHQRSWRYFVITFTGIGKEFTTLQYATNIYSVEFELGIMFLFEHGNGVSYPQKINNCFMDLRARFPEKYEYEITDEQLNEISEIYHSILNFPQQYQDILRALAMFEQLKVVPFNSELYVMGLFAIIELLLSHQVDPISPKSGGSITHQIKTKIPLLLHKYNNTIEYNSYFKPCNEDKMWTKLYQYRSNVAHGNDTSLSGNLSVLHSKDHVRFFLQDIIKFLLRNALKEPQFFEDLKAC